MSHMTWHRPWEERCLHRVKKPHPLGGVTEKSKGRPRLVEFLLGPGYILNTSEPIIGLL